MNGGLFQASRIVASAKKALHDNSDLMFDPANYVLDITFDFLPGESSFHADSVAGWYRECRNQCIEDIKLYVSFDAKEDKDIAGFSNAVPAMLLCFFRDGKVTYFIPRWSSDKEKEGWHIQYAERLWEHPPKGKPSFQDPYCALTAALCEIEHLALTLGEPSFESCFREARQCLTLKQFHTTELTPSLPEYNLKLFLAAQKAFVFGGMGSWNDSPRGKASEMGLIEEYESLSTNLFSQVMSAILFAVNEW